MSGGLKLLTGGGSGGSLGSGGGGGRVLKDTTC